MNMLIRVFSIVLVVLLVIPASAQPKRGHGPMAPKQWSQQDSTRGGWMMPGGMDWGMMNNFGPAYKIMMTIHFLPDMKDTLSLTDQQVEQLDKLQTDFMKQRVDWKASVEKQMIDLHNLIEKNAPVADVRKTLQSISTNRIDMMVAGYTTYQKMLGVLNSSQKDKLDKMKFWGKRSKGMWQQSMRGHGPGGGW